MRTVKSKSMAITVMATQKNGVPSAKNKKHLAVKNTVDSSALQKK